MSTGTRSRPVARRSAAYGGDFLGTDRFEIRQRLGAGSMGTVYRAFDRERGATVALKTLTHADATSIYRFKREFRSLADVVHPNLVVLHDLFADGDVWYFTMEYVEGEDLLTYVQGGGRHTLTPTPRPTPDPREIERIRSSRPQPVVRGLEMMFPSPVTDDGKLRKVLAQVVQGLMAVHAAGKLHRDLKPDNVLVTPQGRAVVLDFGIVTERVPTGHSTLEHDVMGTPAYMAPEQAAGKVVDEASDWYALGAMLYEALTGALPFDGPYLEIMRRKQSEDPPAPSELVYGVPDDLDALCMQLLKRDRSQRPRGTAVLRALNERRAASVHPAPGASIAPPEADVPFIGREDELSGLAEALERTDSGHSALALVQGPSGIGKTTLVQTFLRGLRERSETVVLRGRCYERERVPFKAFDSLVDSLSRYLKRLGAVEAGETLPRDIFALAQLFPVLGRVEVVAQARRRAAPPMAPQELRQRAFAALKEMFRRIADRSRLVVFIDDLQWGDVDSAELIADLVSGDDAPALLLLATFRSGEIEASGCLKTLFERLRGIADLRPIEMTIGPLSPAESRRLAGMLLGDELSSAVDSISAESGGSPHLVAELVRHARTGHQDGSASPKTRDGMVTFERAVLRRVEEVSKGARTLLELLSVAARPVPEEVLALVSAFDVDVQAAMVELRGAKLIRGVGAHDSRAIEPYHDRIREVVARALPVEELKTWHRRLAAMLEATGTEDLEAITEHLLGAEDFRRAHMYAIRAATQAAGALAFEKAARMFAIAVEHYEDPAEELELLGRWADALTSAGQGREAAQVYFDAASAVGDEGAIELRRKAGVQLLLSGYVNEARSLLEEGLGDEAWLLDPTEERTASVMNALRERLAAPPKAVGSSIAPPPSEVVASLDAVWDAALGLTIEGAPASRTALAHLTSRAFELGVRDRAARGLCALHALSPSSDAAPSYRERAEGLARAFDDPRAQAWHDLARARDAIDAGDPAGALEAVDRAETLFRTQCTGGIAEMRLSRVLIGYLATAFGAAKRWPALIEWAAEAEQRDDVVAGTRLGLLASFARLVGDDSTRARDELSQAAARWDRDAYDVNAALEALARAFVEIYDDDQERCQGALYRYDELLASPFAAPPVVRGHLLLMRARTGLIASRSVRATSTVLSRVEQDVHEVVGLGCGCLVHHVRLGRAGLAAAAGDTDTALASLQAVIVDPVEALDASLTRAAALLRKGELMSGDEGALLVAEASEAFRAAGVRNPRRFVRLYAPAVVS